MLHFARRYWSQAGSVHLQTRSVVLSFATYTLVLVLLSWRLLLWNHFFSALHLTTVIALIKPEFVADDSSPNPNKLDDRGDEEGTVRIVSETGVRIVGMEDLDRSDDQDQDQQMDDGVESAEDVDPLAGRFQQAKAAEDDPVGLPVYFSFQVSHLVFKCFSLFVFVVPRT